MNAAYIESDNQQDGSSVDMFRNIYGGVDHVLRTDILSQADGNFREHVNFIEQYGITKVTGLFTLSHIADMQQDVASWVDTKSWNKDMHMSFDGNSRERFLPTSKALSEAVTNPALLVLVTAAFGQHPRQTFVRTYATGPIEHYERRAFAWHHDGYSEIGLKAMILLTDVPEDGQGMKFAPSTQKTKWPTSRSRETQFNSEFADSFEQYVCHGKAGDVFIFNPNAIHRGERNSSETRIVTVVNWQPGIARNYPLPGIHPDVLEGLDEYQKEVYGVGKFDFTDPSLATPANFLDLLMQYRNYMKGVYAKHAVPAEQMRKTIHAVDEQIRQAGERNKRVSIVIPPFIETVTNDDIQSTMAQIGEETEKYQTARSKQGITHEELDHLKSTARELWHLDIEEDLDLPIRMYDPNRDQRRDNAITQTRDRRDAPHFMTLVADIDAVTSASLGQTDLHSFTNAADDLVHFLQDQSTQDADINKQIDSFTCFSQDIQEMLGRAYTTPLMRRTLLFNYLNWVRVEELIHQAGGTRENLDFLSRGRKNAINLYVKTIDFDAKPFKR